MRNIFYILFFILFSAGSILAQTVYNDGITVTVSSGISIYMDGMNFTNQTNVSDGVIENDGDIYVEGDWNNEATGGGVVFDTRDANGTVHFTDGTAQALGSSTGKPTIFESLTINKSANDVTIDEEITVERVLTLTSGDIILGTYDLVLETTATCPGGGSSSSYVQIDNTGVLKKKWDADGAFIYAIGEDAGNYSPFTLTFNSATYGGAAYITGWVDDVANTNLIGSPTNYLDRNWVVEDNDITSPNYDIYLTYVDGDIVGTETELYGGKWSSGAWTSLGAVDSPTNRLGTGGITSFSEFSAAEAAALPIELILFTAKLNGDQVDFAWITATEINNEYFTVERSADALYFEEVIQVPGAGNSNTVLEYFAVDEDPYIGLSYYRLKQTDYDGNYEYSHLVSIEYNPDEYVQYPGEGFNVYPNPAQPEENFYINMTGQGSNEKILVVVRTVLGKLLYSKVVFTDNTGSVLTAVDPDDRLAPGVYIIAGTTKDKYYSKRLIIK